MNKKTNINKLALPTTTQLEAELNREKYKTRYKNLLKSTIHTIIIVIALSILAATYLFSILKISGNSMSPNLESGDIVISIKPTTIENGDIIAFYYNNRILIKRVIATSSEWVNIDESGNVYVNNELINETYIKEKAYGEPTIEFPYQVPEESYFVLGDQRETSIDSRNSLIGAISKNDIIGKIIFKVWPINHFGIAN